MSSQNLPPLPDDANPGSAASFPPSLPPNLPPGLAGDGGLWNDAELHHGPTLAVARTDPDPDPDRDDQSATIGHIGRYALKYALGEGGLGTVYAAHDPLLSRLIAVKTLNVEIEDSEREAFNALFLNEARAAAGLNHTHIVTVFDAGISDNRAYIAMELLKGRDLRQLRLEGWRATPAQAALIVRRVADALAYAHSKGVVHRDVKPANIFMIGRTQPKVLDFGIARVAHRHDVVSDGPATGDIAAGSPYYMAPEQVRADTTDRRSDVFSLGVVLYELLTDVKPFRGNTLSEITTAVLKHEPPLADRVDPAIPHALAVITARALEKNPDHRYRSARAFSRELRHWLDENTISSDGDAPVLEGQRSRRLTWAALATGLVLVGAALSASLHARHDTPAAAAAASASPATAATPVKASVPPAAGNAAADAASVAAGAGATVDAVADISPALPADAAPARPPAFSAAVATALSTTVSPVTAGAASTALRAPRETAKERRTRDARERNARAVPAMVAPATGMLRIAVSPWGEIEVDGKPAGTSPPVTELTLTEGAHQIVIRNTDLPAHSIMVNVTAGQPTSLKHKF